MDWRKQRCWNEESDPANPELPRFLPESILPIYGTHHLPEPGCP